MSSPNTSLERMRSALELHSAYKQIGTDLVLLCQEIARNLRIRPEYYQELIDTGFTKDELRNMVLVGEGQIIPELLFADCSGATALKRLIPSEQRRLLAEGVRVLEQDEQTWRLIPIQSLTPKQVQQVFTGGQLRDDSQQRTYIRALKTKVRPLVTQPIYQIRGQTVIIHQPGTYTKAQLLQMIGEMK